MIILAASVPIKVSYLGTEFRFKMKPLDGLSARRFQAALQAFAKVAQSNADAKPIDWDVESYDASADALWESFAKMIISMECDDIKREDENGEVVPVDIPSDPEGIVAFLASTHFGEEVVLLACWSYQEYLVNSSKKAEKPPTP